jgi:hypothetical protein
LIITMFGERATIQSTIKAAHFQRITEFAFSEFSCFAAAELAMIVNNLSSG